MRQLFTHTYARRAEKRRCHEKHVMDCSHTWEDSTVVKDLPRKIPAGSGTGGGDDIVHVGFETPTDDGSPYYENKYAYLSIPVNNDDDNLNEKPDAEEKGKKVDSEDDYRLVPLAPGHEKCCPCHKCSRKVVVDEIKGDITLWLDESKDKEVSNTSYNIHQKVYVEGLKPSTSPNDASFVCIPEPEGESEEQERITHSFTVYSLRLQPDLNADNRIDIEDAKLVKDMKSLGLGWCVSPGKVSPLKLNVDVKIPGDVYMIVKKTGGKGKIRVYSSEPYHEMDDQTLQFADKGKVTEVSEPQFAIHELSEGGHPDSASQILWLEVSEPGTSGSIEVVYEGTDVADGYECHAKIRFQALDFRIAGDGGVRDGEIKFDDPADTNIVFWVNDDYDVLHWNEGMLQEDDSSSLLKYRNSICKNCDDDIIGAANDDQKGVQERRNFLMDKTSSVQDEQNIGYCFRDLEDFDRIHIRCARDLEMLFKRFVYKKKYHQTDKSVKFKIRFEPVENKQGLGIPQINIFKAVRPDRFYLTGPVRSTDSKNKYKSISELAGDYQKKMIPQMNEERIITVDGDWKEMDTAGLNVEDGDGNVVRETGWWLYEGKEPGIGRLHFRVEYGADGEDCMILADASLLLELHPVADFIETYEIREDNLTNATKFDEWTISVGHPEKTPAIADMPGVDEKDKTYLVLGWNVCPEEKMAWRDTVFKRLFWHGYKGRVGTLIWPTQYGYDVAFDKILQIYNQKVEMDFDVLVNTWKSLNDGPHYDRGEHRAWLSATRFAGKLAAEIDESSHVTFLVHSQGNVLMGEMLRRLSTVQRNKTTYIALHGAASAQLYTRRFQDLDMEATGAAGFLAAAGKKINERKWKGDGEMAPPDIFGHYPFGRKSDPPYLLGVLDDLRHSANFYNRDDYALNIWLGNNATKPDNLAGVGRNDRSFGFTGGPLQGREGNVEYREFSPAESSKGWVSGGHYGRFYQKRDGRQVAIYPGEDAGSRLGDEVGEFIDGNGGEQTFGTERAKWCAFSFVAMSRSLAIGQMPMTGYFRNSVSLKTYGHDDKHYYHSHEFRSHSAATWEVWSEILSNIRMISRNKKEEAE